VAEFSAQAAITTVIPTYRRPVLLARAIRSVLAQSYPHFRLCIYDNASGDETASVVEQFVQSDSRVQYHFRTENIGLCRNFAEAAAHINTPFFSFLSDDDILLPGFYETALASFKKFPEIMMSATASINIDDDGEIVSVPLLKWGEGLYQPPEGMLSMIRNGHPGWTGVLFHRELLDQIGVPDAELGPPFDLDFLLRAAARFSMAVSLQPGALFVIHKNSAGILAGFEGLCPGWYKMTCKIRNDETIAPEVRAKAVSWLNAAALKVLFQSSLSLIASGDWLHADQAIGYLDNYSRLSPPLLKLLVKACQRFGPLRHALSAGKAFRRRVILGYSPISAPDKQLQNQFGSYARCLEL
jgi:glycosyltransferase involved in cell wall biosynthesis